MLKGTEKQVEYAIEIRKATIEFAKRYELKNAVKALEEIEEASFFINNFKHMTNNFMSKEEKFDKLVEIEIEEITKKTPMKIREKRELALNLQIRFKEIEVEIEIEEKAEELEEKAEELTKEFMTRPYDSPFKKCIFIDKDTREIEIISTDENIKGKKLIFEPNKIIDTNIFKLDNTKDLKDLLTYNDFNKFIEMYAEDEEIEVEEAIKSDEKFNLSMLYFFDEEMYKKYAYTQVEEFLKKYDFKLNEDFEIIMYKNNFKNLIGLKDASRVFKKEESTLRRNISNKKFKNDIDCKKFGSAWVFDIRALEREYKDK